MFPVLLSYCALELYLPSIVMQWAQNRFVHRKLLADLLFKQVGDISRSSVRSVLLFLYLKVSFAICLPLQSLLIFTERFITKEEQQSCFSVVFISVCLESPKWSPGKGNRIISNTVIIVHLMPITSYLVPHH